jgi:hypothetical protein
MGHFNGFYLIELVSDGATTLSIVTLSIVTFSTLTLSIMTYSLTIYKTQHSA